MEEIEKLEPLEQTLRFRMMVVLGDNLMPCDVYTARLQDGTEFTRVIAWPGELKAERIIDVDHWEGEGWVDIYTGEPSIWSEMVAASLDFHTTPSKK